MVPLPISCSAAFGRALLPERRHHRFDHVFIMILVNFDLMIDAKQAPR